MENFKIDLLGFLKKSKAYLCMLSYSFLLILLLCPLWFVLMAVIELSAKTVILIIGGALLISMACFYFNNCRKCIKEKVDEICEECKMKKLNICHETIKKCKKDNYEEAVAQIARINSEKDKIISMMSNLKRDHSADVLLKHFDEELKRWEEIKNKNSNI